jgi:hypothetical protein
MTTTLPAYRSYLLRLWRTADGQWRASLETAHDGERLAFASLAALADYLALATEEPPRTRPPSAGGPPAP